MVKYLQGCMYMYKQNKYILFAYNFSIQYCTLLRREHCNILVFIKLYVVYSRLAVITHGTT